MATRNAADGIFRAAASKAVMRSGRHFAQFTVVEGDTMLFGVIPPGYDVEGGTEAHLDYDVDGHCFYDTVDGHRFPGLDADSMGHDWEGMNYR